MILYIVGASIVGIIALWITATVKAKRKAKLVLENKELRATCDYYQKQELKHEEFNRKAAQIAASNSEEVRKIYKQTLLNIKEGK